MPPLHPDQCPSPPKLTTSPNVIAQWPSQFRRHCISPIISGLKLCLCELTVNFVTLKVCSGSADMAEIAIASLYSMRILQFNCVKFYFWLYSRNISSDLGHQFVDPSCLIHTSMSAASCSPTELSTIPPCQLT